MREKKIKIVEKQFCIFFCFFCLLAFLLFFLKFFFLSYGIFFCSFSTYVSDDEQQTNKQTNKIIIIQSYQLALHSLKRGFGDGMESYRPNSWMDTEGG